VASPSTTTPSPTAPVSDVPSYILRKEEMMRKANGANGALTVPTPQPEAQRRDSIDASKAAPEQAEGSVASLRSSSPPVDPGQRSGNPLQGAASCPSSTSVEGRKRPQPLNQVSASCAAHLISLSLSLSSESKPSATTKPPPQQPLPSRPITDHSAAPVMVATQPQAPAQTRRPSESRARVASNPPMAVPIEIQSEPLPKVPETGADMFLGMSTSSPSPVKNTTPAPRPVEEPKPNPIPPSPAPSLPATKSPESSRKMPVPPSPSKPQVAPNNSEVCEKIKVLSAEVVGGFQKYVSEEANLQLQLVEKGRSLRLGLDREEINGRRLQKQVDETEKEQLRLAEAEEFELADALSVKVRLSVSVSL
jgi:hypothetical protein